MPGSQPGDRGSNPLGGILRSKSTKRSLMIKFKYLFTAAYPKCFKSTLYIKPLTLIPENSNLLKVLFIWLILSCYEY